MPPSGSYLAIINNVSWGVESVENVVGDALLIFLVIMLSKLTCMWSRWWWDYLSCSLRSGFFTYDNDKGDTYEGSQSLIPAFSRTVDRWTHPTLSQVWSSWVRWFSPSPSMVMHHHQNHHHHHGNPLPPPHHQEVSPGSKPRSSCGRRCLHRVC